ncbi:hypothetical protein PG996_015346 [Apiospora saccharicola]|uniref:Uncharacterized protein n=1 Tax=Apiospora saccharicola TaxID=335842 RepID=A0ABR1TKZ8_9PEZI
MPLGELIVSRKHPEKPSHMFSSNGASAAAGSTSSSSATTSAAAAPHSHAMRTYVTEPVSAGNRNAALHHGQPSTDAETIEANTTRIQMQINQFTRQFTPRP